VRYFATFIAGTRDIVGHRLSTFPNASLKVEEIQDGLAVFESDLRAEQLSELRFFNNVYQLLADSTDDLPVPDLPARGTFVIRVREGSQPSLPKS
jgi:hypothetical protein